ncbi:MAG: hypothetical protein AAFP97_11060 [Pseudomonadota bacterium]
MKTTTLIASAAALLVLPSAAFASTSTAKNISVCKAEIESQLATTADDMDLDFKTVKGNSRVQTLSFRIDADGEKDKVTCKVRRDDTVEVVWGKTVKPEISKSVEVVEAETAGE